MSDDLRIVGFTLATAVGATLAILPLGIGAAWLLARHRWPGKPIVETALSLPLVLPPTAIGFLLLELLRKDAWFGRALDAVGLDVVFTWKAVVLATAVMSFPLLVRSARAAFEEVEPRLLGVARTLGHHPFAVFWKVALPLAWRGVLAGTLLAFSRALGEFGATILIAGNIPGRTQTMSLAIYHRVQLGHDQAALRLVAVTVVLAFAAVYASELALRRRQKQTS